MPQTPQLVATQTGSCHVTVYDTSQTEPALCQIKCISRDDEGFGLDWNPQQTGLLLTAGNDGKACLWDVAHSFDMIEPSFCTLPVPSRQDSSGRDPPAINDVSWEAGGGQAFACAEDGGAVMIWDIRQPSNAPPSASAKVHNRDVNSVDWHPNNEVCLAVGSSDGTVSIMDVRQMRALHVITAHRAPITRVAWCPDAELPEVLATADESGRVMMWDRTKLADTTQEAQTSTQQPRSESRIDGPSNPGSKIPGAGRSPAAAESDRPAGFLFAHDGHASAVHDLCWCPDVPGNSLAMASVSSVIGSGDAPIQNNVVQFWHPEL